MHFIDNFFNGLGDLWVVAMCIAALILLVAVLGYAMWGWKRFIGLFGVRSEQGFAISIFLLVTVVVVVCIVAFGH